MNKKNMIRWIFILGIALVCNLLFLFSILNDKTIDEAISDLPNADEINTTELKKGDCFLLNDSNKTKIICYEGTKDISSGTIN